MRLIMPRWLVVCEILLLLAGLIVLVYKAANRVLPFPVEAARQLRSTQKAPPRPTILDYYRKYPDRYIRLENESWVLNRDSHSAYHDFSLRNLATVPYTDIVVRITYEGAAGKTLRTYDLKIQGVLQAQATREIKKVKVNDVPEATQNAVATLLKARVPE